MSSDFGSFDKSILGSFRESKCHARGRDYFDGWYIGAMRRSVDSSYTHAYSEDQGLTWNVGQIFGTGTFDEERVNLTWTYKQQRVGGTDRYKDNELNGSGSYQTSNLVYDGAAIPYDESCLLSNGTGVGGNRTLRSTNLGKTWDILNTGIAVGAGRPYYAPNGYYYVLGYRFDGLSPIFYTSISGDYGATWTPLRVLAGAGLTSLSSIGSGMVWYKAGKYYAFSNWGTQFVGVFGTSLFTSSDGFTWQYSSTDPDIMLNPTMFGATIGGVIVMPSGRLLNHGRTYQSNLLWKSDDDGLNWSAISSKQAHFIDEYYRVFRLVLTGTALTIEVSTDEGDSWSFYSNGPTNNSGGWSAAGQLLSNRQILQ